MARYYPRSIENYAGGLGLPPRNARARTAEDRLGDYLGTVYDPNPTENYGIFDEDMRAGRAGHRQRLLLQQLAAQADAEQPGAGAGIPEGVAYPEGPLHWAGRNTLGRLGIGDWQAPQGEPADERIARLMGAQQGEEAKQKRAQAAAKILFDFADDLDPEGRKIIAPKLEQAYRDAGVDVPEGFAEHLKAKKPESEFEAFQRGGKDRQDVEAFRALMREHAPRQETADEAEFRNLQTVLMHRRQGNVSPEDKAFLQAYHLKHGKTQRPASFDERAVQIFQQGGPEADNLYKAMRRNAMAKKKPSDYDTEDNSATTTATTIPGAAATSTTVPDFFQRLRETVGR